MKLGLPMVFKAINVETGEECKAAETPLKDRAFSVWDHGRLSIMDRTEWSLVQATGFTDAAGKDVYFGDVLMDDHSRIPYIVQMNDDQICALIVDGFIDLVEVIYPQSGRFDCLFFVGNTYEPPSRWLERAREIWPGAELPEGVRG